MYKEKVEEKSLKSNRFLESEAADERDRISTPFVLQRVLVLFVRQAKSPIAFFHIPNKVQRALPDFLTTFFALSAGPTLRPDESPQIESSGIPSKTPNAC
jgi:hypothetical protein